MEKFKHKQKENCEMNTCISITYLAPDFFQSQLQIKKHILNCLLDPSFHQTDLIRVNNDLLSHLLCGVKYTHIQLTLEQLGFELCGSLIHRLEK